MALSQYGFSPVSSSPSGAGGSIVDRHFDYLRQQQEANISNSQNQNKEALDRQAAAQGMGGSGAFVKLQDQNNQASDNARTNAINDVEGQRALALGQMAQGDKQLEFQYKQLGAQQEENAANRDFQASQASQQRAFQSSEAAQERGFNKQLFDKEEDFKNRSLDVQDSQFGKQMEMAMYQMTGYGPDGKKTLDREATEFNEDMATKQYNKKDIMEWFANMHGYNPRTGQQGTPGGQAGGQAYGAGVLANFL